MSEHQALCCAAFCSPPLSSESTLKLLNLTNVDWQWLWNFFLKHKTLFIAILEEALKLLPSTGVWADLVVLIEKLLTKQAS